MTNDIIDFLENEVLVGTGLLVDKDDNLLEQGIVDSIGIMRLVAFVEETCNLKIPPQDLVIENFMTVQKLADYLESQKAS